MHDDTLQHSLFNGQAAHINSSTDYQCQNRRLSFGEGNKRNFNSQISTVPELRDSPFIRKSNSISMSSPHLGPSALTQVIPSINTTIASAADSGASNPSASQSIFQKNLPCQR